MEDEDFGAILDAWENRAPASSQVEDEIDMNDWLDSHPVVGKDDSLVEENISAQYGQRRRQLKSMVPQEIIDLHGMTGEEATHVLQRKIELFFSRGVEKMLIIHGKGAHSAGAAVLPSLVQQILQQHPQIGEFGSAERKNGGSGATWAILRLIK